MIILKYFFEVQILNIHDLNTNLNYLSSNVLSLYCVFWRSKFSFVFNSWTHTVNDFGIWNFQAIRASTFLSRIHIHWPESKFTKSNINSKKVMKSITSITISRLFSWIKKYMSLCLELLQFVLLIFITPLPSASCHILVHVKSLRSSLGRIWAKQVKMPPLFFRIKVIFPKCPQHCLAKWHA